MRRPMASLRHNAKAGLSLASGVDPAAGGDYRRGGHHGDHPEPGGGRARGAQAGRGDRAAVWQGAGTVVGRLADVAGLVFVAMERLPGLSSGRMARWRGTRAIGSRGGAVAGIESAGAIGGVAGAESGVAGGGVSRPLLADGGRAVSRWPGIQSSASAPAWFTGLSSAQRAAWESLKAAASSGATLRKSSSASPGSRRRTLGRKLKERGVPRPARAVGDAAADQRGGRGTALRLDMQ